MALILIIVVAPILFSTLRWMATPIILTIGIAYFISPEAAGIAFIPIVILTVIAKAHNPNF